MNETEFANEGIPASLQKMLSTIEKRRESEMDYTQSVLATINPEELEDIHLLLTIRKSIAQRFLPIPYPDLREIYRRLVATSERNIITFDILMETIDKIPIHNADLENINMQKIIDALDTNNDRIVDEEEWLAFFQFLSFLAIINRKEIQASALFDIIDMDGGGEISREEFVNFLANLKAMDMIRLKNLDQLFDVIGNFL